MRNCDGAVLAMVGSRDYFDAAHAGAVNVTTIARRPGSTLSRSSTRWRWRRVIRRRRWPTTSCCPRDARDVHRRRQAARPRALSRIAGRLLQPVRGAHAAAGRRAALVERLRNAGMTTLTEPDAGYGLSLAIGDAEFA